MEQKEKEILLMLEQDIKSIGGLLRETNAAIVKDGYSKFPIVVVHDQPLDIAVMVIDKSEHNTCFHYSATTLEQMIERKVILEGKRAAFEQQISSGDGKACFMLAHPEVLKFVFSPL